MHRPFTPIRVQTFVAILLLQTAMVFADTPPDSLRILLYGATGKIGSHVVNEALNRNHLVTAVSRKPSSITQTHEHLSAVKGDILDIENIRQLLGGQDVVIVSVRGVVGKSKDPNQSLQRLAVGNIVNVLREMGDEAPRLIHVGGAGSLEVKPGVLYADKLPKLFLPKSLEVEIAGQILALQYLRSIDDVNWTYATPPKNLTNGKRTGEFRIGGDQVMEDSRGRSRVSRADFAVALIDEAENAKHVRERFSVAY